MLRNFIQKIKSSSFNQWVETIGKGGLFVFVFGMLLRKSIAHAGIITMCIAFGFSLKDRWQEVVRDRLVQLSAAFFIFLIIRTFFAALEFPEHISLLVAGAFKLFGAGFLLAYVTAFWLHRARNDWDKMLVVLLSGFLMQILRQMDWANVLHQLHQIGTGVERATFGFSTNRFGLFSALIALACVILYRQIWGPPDKWIWNKVRISLWGLLLILSTLGLVFSQSRSAWFAFAVVMPAAVLWKLRQTKRPKTIVLIASIFLLTALMTGFPKIIERRLGSGIDADSISARMSLYQIAWENWKNHVLFGCGPGTSWIMIQQAGEEHNAVKLYDHLHNVVLDIGAQIGATGIVFFVLSFSIIVIQAFAAESVNSSDRMYILFALSGIALIMLTGLPNQPLSSPHGVYLLGFLGGICYSFKFSSTHLVQTNFSRDKSK